MDHIKRDMGKINITEEDAQDRSVWRGKKASRLQMALAVSKRFECLIEGAIIAKQS
jgi:hypothetical protein